jgi:hypothetical protein
MNTAANEIIYPVGPEDVIFRPEEAACCCVCLTSIPTCVGEKHFPRVNSDLRQSVEAPLTSPYSQSGPTCNFQHPNFKTQLSIGTIMSGVFRIKDQSLVLSIGTIMSGVFGIKDQSLVLHLV